MELLEEGPCLIGFFSLTSIGTLRLLHYFQAWRERYEKHGLRLVTIHRSDLDRARDPLAIKTTLQYQKLNLPVVADSPQEEVFKGLGGTGLGCCLLFRPGGKLKQNYPPGTSPRQIEIDLQRILAKRMPTSVRLLDPLFPEDTPGRVILTATDEIHLGYRFGQIANPQGYLPHQTIIYEGSVTPRQERPSLGGGWQCEAECLVTRPMDGEPSTLEIQCTAKDIYLLAEAAAGAEIEIESTAGLIPSESATKDWAKEQTSGGKSIPILEFRLYHLLSGEHLRRHHLKIRCHTDGLRVYKSGFTTEGAKQSG